MRSQACEPCAKRKVRCDRTEPPCSNCKRRKHDRCAYPEVSPFDRIRKLEETVRALGGDPTSDQPEKPRDSSAPVDPGKSGTSAETPIILQEEGRSIYHESERWRTWMDVSRLYKGTKPQFNNSDPRGSALSPGKFLPHAFQGSPWRDNHGFPKALTVCPIPTEDAVKLWDFFLGRVEPVTKISFAWTLAKLRAALSDAEKWMRLDDGEHALLLSTCLFGAKANVDALTSRSLWSLMGLVSRSAEQLGLHRDGTVLGLSPIETEERRRLWWQLQHLDMILSLKNGVTPLSFGAAWDVKLPLNIEDSDLDPTSSCVPKERTRLTSFSYTLFIYYVIDKQHKFRVNQSSQPTAGDNSLLGCLTDAMIDDLETSLNERFVQYCDPIEPLHTLLHITARAVINVLRLRKLHESRMQSEHVDDKCHIEHFNTCMQALKYISISHSNPQLKPFAWLLEEAFVWHAFIGVLVDMSNLKDVDMIKSAWALLAELYAVVDHISNLSDDRRYAHAAKSVVATWYECRQKLDLRSMQKPDFVSELERRLGELESNIVGDTANDGQTNASQDFWQGRPGEEELQPFGFEFTDIDWAFWDSVS
ncbi:hypothetical protein FALBO_3509 [Fusarium albosuccineum]|uniref:Zn(2)-C6 fungal-type domain-containing protein n=1 Tax=Fusarium albosuccineum TaxID=1237068 RepID=A0A8H4LHM0_9HYPO|nr:hypothetical protein FALBO_3509 [Fusarium albosuccineum]